MKKAKNKVYVIWIGASYLHKVGESSLDFEFQRVGHNFSVPGRDVINDDTTARADGGTGTESDLVVVSSGSLQGLGKDKPPPAENDVGERLGDFGGANADPQVLTNLWVFCPKLGVDVAPALRYCAGYCGGKRTSPRFINLTSNLYIIRVALNTGFDTACLSGWHTHMTHFGVYHLVCPFSKWPGQGFYVDLFLIDAFPSDYQSK